MQVRSSPFAGGAVLCAALSMFGAAQAQREPPAAAAPTPAQPFASPSASQTESYRHFERLSDALDAAERLARAAEIAGARSQAVQARLDATDAFFAGAPTVGFDYRRDTPAFVPQLERLDPRGRNEYDYGISAPIWLPGERALRRQVLSVEREQAHTLRAAERLALAGSLRERVWAVRRAQIELDWAQRRREDALRLEADVARRVEAGEVARADLLIARNETFTAAAAHVEAQAAWRRAGARLLELTGSPLLPGEYREEGPAAGSAGDVSDDPRVRLASLELDRAQAAASLASGVRRDNPTVSVSLRNERDESGADYRNSLQFGIRIPLDTEARNAPRLAEAVRAVASAQARVDEQTRTVLAQRHAAQADLEAADRRIELAGQRLAAADEGLQLGERAYALGERSLVELLRLRGIERDARLELDSARTGRDAARAALMQSMGLMP